MAVYKLHIANVVMTSSNDSIIPRPLTMTAIQKHVATLESHLAVTIKPGPFI